MDFLKAGEPVESNIFNQLDEKKRALIEKGVDVINLSIGTPDFQPDKHVMEAVSRAALDPDMYKYSLTETPELLDAVEKWYKRRYDVDLADDEIIQVSGSQEGFAHIGFAFAGPNDLILAPDPGYPIFTFGPLMTGATIALYPLREENNWQLDFNDIPEDIAERAKAIVVSYPNNPTTAVADRAFYEKLVTFAREHNMIVLHDNAYSDLMLDGTDGLSFLSIPGAKEVGGEFNSLSKTYNRRVCERWMRDGVTILDPETTWIEDDVQIGRDATILPGSFLQGHTVVGEDAIVGPYTTLIDATVDEGAVVERSRVQESHIGARTNIGPWTYLRPGNEFGEDAKAGAFVEMKKAHIGNGTKVPHLSYVGDAQLGDHTNIGGGTITANYDGVHKNRTTIGSGCHVGAGNLFVAPVEVGDNVTTGAGSVVRHAVPSDTMVYSENTQHNVEGWKPAWER